MRSLILITTIFLILFAAALAQESETSSKSSNPFEVVTIESHWISIDSVCRILHDSGIVILTDMIIVDSHRLLYHYKGSWFECEIQDPGLYGQVEYHKTYTTADIDYDGMSELLIESEMQLYGSGGGTTDYRATIYKFDTIVHRIFDGAIGSAEEMFGREYNNGANYFQTCQQEIIFKRGELRFLPSSDAGSWVQGMHMKKEKCSNNVKPGVYEIKDGQLVLKQPKSKKRGQK